MLKLLIFLILCRRKTHNFVKPKVAEHTRIWPVLLLGSFTVSSVKSSTHRHYQMVSVLPGDALPGFYCSWLHLLLGLEGRLHSLIQTWSLEGAVPPSSYIIQCWLSSSISLPFLYWFVLYIRFHIPICYVSLSTICLCVSSLIHTWLCK